MRAGSTSVDAKSAAVTAIVILVVFGVGFAAYQSAGGKHLRDQAPHDRAESVYGEDYKIVDSGECWDYCVMTATTTEQQVADIRYTLIRADTWVSGYTLMQSTPGDQVDRGVLEKVAAAPDIETHSGDGWLDIQTEYRYTGEATAEPLSDATVRERVHRRLFLTGASMGVDAIASDLPVGQQRVEYALHSLAADGAVDSGYVTTRHTFFAGYQWIDTRHGRLPDGRFHQFQGIFLSILLVLTAVIIVWLLKLYRTAPKGGGA
jgi:hypothetical protein